MGLAAPSIGQWKETDSRGLAREIKEQVEKVTEARASRELMRGLAEMSGEDSSGLSKAAGALGEAFSGLAKGIQAAGDLQGKVLEQVAGRLGSGGSGSLGDALGLVILMEHLEDWRERREERRRQRTGEAEESPILRRYLDKLERDLQEAKQRGGPSPADEQVQQLALSLLSNHISTASDPLARLKELREFHETAQGIFGRNGTPPEYSEGALRLRAIEKDELGLKAEHDRYMAQLEQRERELALHYPRLIGQALTGLAQVASAFGLLPTQPLQFGADEDAEAEAALAAARKARAGGEGAGRGA